MRHNIKLLALLCGTIYGSAQNDYKGRVGINTQTPAVTLDVSGKSSDPKSADGLVAPRMTRAELLAKNNVYTDAQEGAIVYITTIGGEDLTEETDGIKTRGYYYWNGVRWIPMGNTQLSNTTSSSGWKLTGNLDITSDNFIGTLDDTDIFFKRKNEHAGYLKDYSTAFGVGALPNSTLFSVAFGNNALNSNISGMSNTAIGSGALGKVISSEHNVAIGTSALRWTLGGKHAVVGSQAFLFNKNGSANTGVGFNIFYENKEGSGNVGLGFEAGYFSLGSKNIAIGYGARNFANNSGNNQLNIGNVIFGLNMSEFFDNKNGKIGIGIVAPTETLEINGNVRLHSQGRIIENSQCQNLGTIGFHEEYFFGCVKKNNQNIWVKLNL